MVPLVQWKTDRRKYSHEQLQQLGDFIVRYRVTGTKVNQLIYAVLQMTTGIPAAELRSMITLPSYSTQWRVVLTVGHLRKLQLADVVGSAHVYGHEYDEGTHRRTAREVINYNVPGRGRAFSGAPVVRITSEEERSALPGPVMHSGLCVRIYGADVHK